MRYRHMKLYVVYGQDVSTTYNKRLEEILFKFRQFVQKYFISAT